METQATGRKREGGEGGKERGGKKERREEERREEGGRESERFCKNGFVKMPKLIDMTQIGFHIASSLSLHIINYLIHNLK